jgi:prepilin-type processing-associated H-X9-DG protein
MPRHRSRHRSAYALIELLLVTAIALLLLGLLLAALQRGREAANRVSCANNLKQIALGILMHQDAYGYFPVNSLQPGGGSEDCWTWNSQKNQASWSWMARTLPFLAQGEQSPPARLSETTFRQSAGVLATPISIFFCPSDSARSQPVSLNRANLEGVPIALTNYKGVSGSNWCWGDWYCAGPTGNCDGLDNGNGLFYRSDWQSPRRQADITDGASNTLMIGEDLPAKNTHCSWAYANNAVGTCAIAPNDHRSGGCEYEPTDWANVYSFRSRHTNGLQFALADGSVHFLSNQIPLQLYRALATINGNELSLSQEF